MTDSPRPFDALRVPGFRAFLLTFMLTMMADNIEHVMSYWVAFQKFHSSALGGFAVVSHWTPYLLFSVPVGSLNDRFDSRRLIQIGACSAPIAITRPTPKQRFFSGRSHTNGPHTASLSLTSFSRSSLARSGSCCILTKMNGRTRRPIRRKRERPGG